ncbi:hypothetical protein GOP47_0018894 [Adiantum capillus-veneris]|uniref:Uncharacterized protein n=1 Tax=Adiantum capillus-veneris TaxID=13818 RepID=A0A9D4UEE0_ADICA|nr:hypothetical protein GOP47_0018894 [Adiantum capillus-veneris]
MAQSARMLPCHHAVGGLVGQPYRSCYGRFLSLHARSSLFDSRTGAFDPGNWVFSPEWWGTQGCGWGRNPGTTVFEQPSHKGNGLVSVTAHPASSSGLEDWPELSKLLQGRQVTSCEWRVLRFNHETRQSVAKVVVVEGQDYEEPYLVQVPSCLAFEYLKSMVSVGLSSINCAGLNLELVAQGKSKMRCLCIGLGGGSLPLFLANKLQGCFMEVVEIDKTVISAATECMGFPKNAFKVLQQSDHGLSLRNALESSFVQEGLGIQRHSYAKYTNDVSHTASSLWGKLPDRIIGVEADGVAYVRNLLKDIGLKGQHYDLAFIDAYDGKDDVPSGFWNRGGPFLTGLRDLLNPHHGTAVVNLHTDSLPPSFLERIRGEFGPGFDPHLPGGKQLQEISQMYRDELLWCQRHSNALKGAAFTVAVPRQQNICLVVSRGIIGMKSCIVQNLTSAACYLERVLDIPFPMSKRVARGFKLVP